MSAERTAGTRHGIPASELQDDERVLRYGRTHEGRGVLTNRRLFLQGHPSPIHRPILWSVGLESLTELEVVEPSFSQAYRVQTQVVGGGYAVVGAAGHADPASYDALFLVRANEATVFSGDPGRAEQVQRWIDEARVARTVAVRGT